MKLDSKVSNNQQIYIELSWMTEPYTT